MNTRRISAIYLGFLLVGPALFAQTPHPGLPSAPLWRVQPQENPAQRQVPKLNGNFANPQAKGMAMKRGTAPIQLQPNRTRPKIYRPRRGVRSIT